MIVNIICISLVNGTIQITAAATAAATSNTVLDFLHLVLKAFFHVYCLSLVLPVCYPLYCYGYSVSPNIRTYVYKYGMSSAGSESDWEVLWEKYQQETVPQERVKLLYGLANTKEIWLLNRYIQYCRIAACRNKCNTQITQMGAHSCKFTQLRLIRRERVCIVVKLFFAPFFYRSFHMLTSYLLISIQFSYVSDT